MKKQKIFNFILLMILFTFGFKDSANVNNKTIGADVIIYGGTSAAVTAAVEISRMGKSVLIVCPDKHLGGMTSSGLGWTDTGDKSVIGGLAREFYQRVYKEYSKSETWRWEKKEDYGNKGQGTPALDGANRTMWIFEPHIAEKVFEDLVKERNIKVYKDEWLDRKNGVEKKNGMVCRLVYFTMAIILVIEILVRTKLQGIQQVVFYQEYLWNIREQKVMETIKFRLIVLELVLPKMIRTGYLFQNRLDTIQANMNY
jgi:hypothetical protein